jgi:hypothetical protein
MGSRKSSVNPDRIEKRKSSVFGRSKSTKMNLDVIQLESVIGKTVIFVGNLILICNFVDFSSPGDFRGGKRRHCGAQTGDSVHCVFDECGV